MLTNKEWSEAFAKARSTLDEARKILDAIEEQTPSLSLKSKVNVTTLANGRGVQLHDALRSRWFDLSEEDFAELVRWGLKVFEIEP